MDNENFINTSVTTAAIDVTYKCNLRCLHCFNSSGEHNFGYSELSDDEIFDVAKQLGKIEKLQSLCFCGGETLLRKNVLLKAAEYLKDKNNLNVNMVTNGILMTKEIAKDLKKAGFTYVQVSVDGARHESHDWLRNKNGAFNKAIDAIKYLVDADLKVGVACTPTKKNINEIHDVVELCSNLGVTMLRMQRVMNLGRASKNLNNMFLNYMEYRKIAKELLGSTKKGGKLEVEWGDPLAHLISGRTGSRKLDYLGINAYGYITGSPYLPIMFGNIRNGSLKQYFNKGLDNIWDSKFLKKVASYTTTESNLDVSEQTDLPKIFTGKDIEIDLLKENLAEADERLFNEYDI